MIKTENKTDLKTLIQPRKLAKKEGELKYRWQVKDFERLDGLLFSNEGFIEVHLSGRQDNRNRCLVEAHIIADVVLQCQTSFEPIEYQVDASVLYCTVIKEEQIVDLDEEYEPLLVDDGQVDIKEVIEDELILSLPLIANKASKDLGIQMSYGELPKEAETKKNPFKVLENVNFNKK
ncbi:MAG: DUF177 domain-containing protein [Kangiellaceae bacterium]|nr:DUF177 domain-containing protein [Kangiellaceae bacterium]